MQSDCSLSPINSKELLHGLEHVLDLKSTRPTAERNAKPIQTNALKGQTTQTSDQVPRHFTGKGKPLTNPP
jgi:hypothetical protein